MEAAVAGLTIYPVKSCHGISMLEARLGERGLERDREWMVVDTVGHFLSQRELPRLALITPALSDSRLELAAPGMTTCAVSLDVRGPTRSVSVWRDTVSATDEGDQVAGWLSEWLGRAARLVRFDPGTRRLCNPAYAGTSGAHTAFADAYPLLVISEASLADLNHRLAIPLPMNRFRPNLVLSGIEAYDEDHIGEIRFGRSALKLVKPCTRCRTTTTDQATAEVGIEPLRTLALYRRNDALDGVTFGMNAIVAAGTDEIISVGDRANCLLSFAD